MCIACLEYQKGLLTAREFLRNRQEIGENVEHDTDVYDMEAMSEFLSQIFDEENN